MQVTLASVNSPPELHVWVLFSDMGWMDYLLGKDASNWKYMDKLAFVYVCALLSYIHMGILVSVTVSGTQFIILQ